MLAAKASPELVRRAKRAAAISSVNVSSLVRYGVMRLCEEIERDGFLTIRAEEPASAYTTGTPQPECEQAASGRRDRNPNRDGTEKLSPPTTTDTHPMKPRKAPSPYAQGGGRAGRKTARKEGAK